jgi:segregation and condensation protein B
VEEGHLLNAERESPLDDSPAGGVALPDDARLDATAEPALEPSQPVAAEEPPGPEDETEAAPAEPAPDEAAEQAPPTPGDVEGSDADRTDADLTEAGEPDAARDGDGPVECGPADLAGPLDALADVPAENVPSESGQVGGGPAKGGSVEGLPVAGRPAEQRRDVPADEDGEAQIAVVDDLAAALGLDGSVTRDADTGGPDDSGEAVVAVAASQLAAPPPGLAEADLIPALEAILLVVDEPVSEITLAEVLEVPAELVAGTLIDLSAAYTRQNRGFDLRRAAGGWRLYTRAEYAPYVERFVLDGQQLRLTQASLETLAVVAYKQPVTRSRISAIRGVNCDGVIRTLVTRGMIEECGTEPESGAYLYRTTSLFLEKLGLDSVDQLPPLAPFLPDNVEEIADEQR